MNGEIKIKVPKVMCKLVKEESWQFQFVQRKNELSTQKSNNFFFKRSLKRKK